MKTSAWLSPLDGSDWLGAKPGALVYVTYGPDEMASLHPVDGRLVGRLVKVEAPRRVMVEAELSELSLEHPQFTFRVTL
jgi:hypothetical protein